MVALSKTEIIDQLKRIGLDNPSEISPYLKKYKKYHLGHYMKKKELRFIKYFKLIQCYLMYSKLTCSYYLRKIGK